MPTGARTRRMGRRAAAAASAASAAWLLALAGCGGARRADNGSAPDDTAATDAGTPWTSTPGSAPPPPADVPQSCEEAVAKRSYVGCEYWPTVTPNSELFGPFAFAVAIANPGAKTANVHVTRGGSKIVDVQVGPGELRSVELPWVGALRQSVSGKGLESALVADGAYRLSSSVPVVAYQFNPVDFAAKDTFSYTNDASLLLPTSALRGEYRVLAWPTHHYTVGGSSRWSDQPGFVAVTAAVDGTTVEITSTAHVRAGTGVAAIGAGGKGTWRLDAGDVLVLESADLPSGASPAPGEPCVTRSLSQGTFTLCPSPPSYDLSGSRIEADRPVQVIAGHDCAMIPYDSFACDHLEESLLPVDALGNQYVVAAPEVATNTMGTAGTTPDATVVRVLSAADGNVVHVEPPGVQKDVTLAAGAWIEIGPTTSDLVVTGTRKLLVAQYMVGENWKGRSGTAGDPSQSSAVPTAQYRVSYSFFAPASYTYNFVNVVARTGTRVKLDGQSLPPSSFAPIGASGWSVLRWPVSGRAHAMTGDAPFGITVYGYGAYTSYMYPGGLDLATIVD